MARFRLTRPAKIFTSVVIVAALGATLRLNPSLLGSLAPRAAERTASVPPAAPLPGESAATATITSGDFPVVAKDGALCESGREVRMLHWAWNAQMGLVHATGGKRARADSAMCRAGVDLRLVREDNVDAMQAALAKFAEAHAAGEAHPMGGAHFVSIMGDGSAAFMTGLNERLAKLGPDYRVVVVGSAGTSRGEDKLMGPPAWRDNPQAAKGGVVAGVLRDGDWNIAMKWLADNRIANNPNESTYDPDALNWVGAADYIDAAQKYVSGYCTELRNVKTGKPEKRCVDAVVTWTPGDVTVAEKRGGLVSIVSTKEYRSQMPNVLIGHKKWMHENQATTVGLLRAIFEGGERVRSADTELRSAAAISAAVYGERDAAYWYRYFTVQDVKDRQGLAVQLGGSSVSTLADNRELFGLNPGSANAFAATYTVFGNVVRSQYPDLLPRFPPASEVVDLSFLELLGRDGAGTTAADAPSFDPKARVERIVSRRVWQLPFATGSAAFTPAAAAELEPLLADLVVASGTMVELHGHTDGAGNADANMRLSEDRAFAVRRWLEQRAPHAFPEGRVRVFAHGQTEPVASNTTDDGRAKNRRVVIVLGTER